MCIRDSYLKGTSNWTALWGKVWKIERHHQLNITLMNSSLLATIELFLDAGKSHSIKCHSMHAYAFFFFAFSFAFFYVYMHMLSFFINQIYPIFSEFWPASRKIERHAREIEVLRYACLWYTVRCRNFDAGWISCSKRKIPMTSLMCARQIDAPFGRYTRWIIDWRVCVRVPRLLHTVKIWLATRLLHRTVYRKLRT